MKEQVRVGLKLMSMALLSTVLLAGSHGGKAVAQDDAASEDGAERLQSLLDEAGMFFKRQDLDDGTVRFRIAVEGDGHTSVIVCYVNTWTWKRPDGSTLESVMAYTQVLPPPAEGAPYSRAVLAMLSERAEYIRTGNYSATDNGIYANSGFYLQGLDADLLASYLYALHYNRVNLINALAPVLESEEN